MTVKKVLHIAGNMQLGGAETLLININRNINADKLRFDYATETITDGFYAQEIKGLKGHIYPFILRRVPFASYWANVFNLVKIIKKNGPYCALHVHYTYENWFFLAVAWFCGIKKRISHAHTTGELNSSPQLLKILRRKLILFFATDLFACSMRAGVDLYGINAQFKVINNAIDCTRFAYNPDVREKQRKQLNLEGKFVVCTVGRLESYKNHAFLIDVFAEVCKSNQNAVLMIIGGGSKEQYLKNKAAVLGLQDKIMFLGPREDSEVLLQAADVFVFPSLFEGFGIAAIEAQAAGLPCVISANVPHEAEVVNCKILTLALGHKIWAQEVLTYTDFERKDQSSAVKAAGFDIKTIALELQDFYLK